MIGRYFEGVKKIIEAWRKCDKVYLLFFHAQLHVAIYRCKGKTFFFLRYSAFGSFNMKC